MQTSDAGLNLIKQFEGFSPTQYYCPAGKLTIGYGHAIIPGEQFPQYGITELIAENLLKQDVIMAERVINNLVETGLLQNQFDALVSFVYNIGSKAFEESTLLRLINANKVELAAQEFSRWIYAAGVIQQGLVKRRAAEKIFFCLQIKGGFSSIKYY